MVRNMSESEQGRRQLNEDLIKSIFEQHWLQIRHIESERLWFTNIYAAIMAGVLAFITKGAEISLEFYAPLLFFLILLTIIGIIIVVRLGLAFYQHAAYALLIAETIGVGKYMGALWRWKAIGKEARNLRDALFTVAAMFLLFYMVSLGGLLTMIFYIYIGLSAVSFLTFVLIIPIFVVVIRWQNKKSNEIMQRVKSSL